MPEQQRLWLRIWSGAPGIGWQRLQCLERAFNSLEAAWKASDEEIRRALASPTRLGQRGLEQLLHYRAQVGPSPLSQPASAEQRQRWRGTGVLLCGDAALPTSLAALERPPVALYWQGRGSLWAALRERQAVAVVGTRRPSRHGEAMARAIGRALAEAGWPVVSGLAEGIDAAAHQACLEAGGRPVAILGTPLERVYPRHHQALQDRVAEAGLLVSELPAGTAVRAGHFAERNRLQVALACAVVLVECPRASGALHSAQLAWQVETPLWVVPADTSRVSAAGSNRWLGQGATPLLEPEDLINQLGPGPLKPDGAPPRPPAGAAHSRSLEPGTPRMLIQREAALLAALGAGASLEQLCDRLRQRPDQISERLLQLELAGMVHPEPGLWWRPG
jgi:DNA processing protein